MEEEYLSLYEPVDEFQLERNKITHNNYEKLKTSHCNHEEYQQPQSVTTQRDYSEKIHIDIELQLIKKDMRRVKTCFCIGGLIMLVLVTVSLITLIALSIRVSKKSVNVTRIKEINTIGNGSVYIPNDIASVRVFEDCFQESVNCSFSKVDEGIWLSCATDNLNLNKKNYYTVEVRCEHAFDPVQHSVTTSSIQTLSKGTEVYCQCSVVHPTSPGHSILPPPSVTPNCILIITRCPQLVRVDI